MTDRPPRRRLSPEDRREDILTAARAAFRETGPYGTTMADVAERAGITQTHLYRHFRKEDLYQHAILAPLEELGERVVQDTKDLAQRPDITRAQLLEHFHELCLAYFVQLVPLLRAGGLPGGLAGPWLYQQSLFPKWRDVVVAVTGDISGWEKESVNVEMLVQALMGLYATVALIGELDNEPVRVDRVAARLVSMFAPAHLDERGRAALRRAAKRIAERDPAAQQEPVAPPPAKPAERRRLSKAERQASILTAARGLFCEVGFSGARTQDLAERSGITEAFLYRQFDSKEQLYERAIEAPVEAALIELAQSTRALGDKHAGVVFVIELNTLVLRFLIEHGTVLATAMQADLDRSRRFYRERAEPHFDEVGAVIIDKLGYDTKQITPRLAWCAFLGSVWGVTVEVKARGAEADVDAIALNLARLFTLGVLPRN